MKIRFSLLISLLFIYCASSFAQFKQLQAVKNESTITYRLSHPLHTVEAVSKNATCIVNADPAKKEIKNVSVQVDVTTFDSGNSNRDSHAMETIDAISYPDARFVSTSINQEGDSLKVHGKLTFHGVTKSITIDAVSKWASNKLSVSGSFVISLTAFKVSRPALLLVPTSDDLRFSLVQVFNL